MRCAIFSRASSLRASALPFTKMSKPGSSPSTTMYKVAPIACSLSHPSAPILLPCPQLPRRETVLSSSARARITTQQANQSNQGSGDHAERQAEAQEESALDPWRPGARSIAPWPPGTPPAAAAARSRWHRPGRRATGKKATEPIALRFHCAGCPRSSARLARNSSGAAAPSSNAVTTMGFKLLSSRRATRKKRRWMPPPAAPRRRPRPEPPRTKRPSPGQSLPARRSPPASHCAARPACKARRQQCHQERHGCK
jgi:hypothetical protein